MAKVIYFSHLFYAMLNFCKGILLKISNNNNC